MNSNYYIPRYLVLFAVFAALFIAGPAYGESTNEAPEQPSESEEQSQYWGNGIYGSPVTLDYHLKRVAEDLERKVMWRIESHWRVRKLEEERRKLTPSEEQFAYKNIEKINQLLRDVERLSQGHYESVYGEVAAYVDPERMPEDLAWEIGKLLAVYGNNTNLLGRYDDAFTLDDGSVITLYKASLLHFAYALGLRESAPPVMLHTTIDDMLASPRFKEETDLMFDETFRNVDERQWIAAIAELDQQHQDPFCRLLRAIYLHIVKNKETLPEAFAGLDESLYRITADTMLTAQNNPSFSLDAINPWMFKLMIDLKNWEDRQWQKHYQKELLPRCLQLLPPDASLKDVTEEDEFAICEKVRIRNLLPGNAGNEDQGKEIVDEFEFSPATMRWTFIYTLYFLDEKARYGKGTHSYVKPMYAPTEHIYNYASGYVEINDLPITKENALDYLINIKVFDMLTNVWNSHYHVEYELNGMHFGSIGFDLFHFPRSTYELRKHILKLCPHLASYEALTVSVNPEKVSDEKEDISEEGWIEESERLRQECIADLLESAHYLSDAMNREHSPLKGIVVGARGISGAGKSTFLKRNILSLLLPEGSGELELLAQGILNPDTIKAALKKLQGDTLNTQVHFEGVNAFQRVFSEIADTGSYILDRRLLSPHDIQSDLIAPAKEKGSSVWLFDLDISLAACITRILARPLHGNDPCPEFEVLVDGLLAARRYRPQVAALAAKEEAISRYELYATGRQHLIAHKADGRPCPHSKSTAGNLCIHDPALYAESFTEPSYLELEEELAQIIDTDFIDRAISLGWIAAEQRAMLEQWLGMTLKESIQRHVQGSKDNEEEERFEAAEVSAFNGEEWLSDMPQLIAFLESEHQLHVRGVDETGEGLHWEAGQLERGLNPKYNPEATAPESDAAGIQMKMGYFILPMDNLDLYLSQNLSPNVTRELTVRDDNGELIGLRFFVHPEAYAHFAPLLDAGISFVPPSESEFMGSPTASYHSWVVRNTSLANRTPFIIKMGTPNGQSDIRHLLPGDEVVRSLVYQKYFDTLPESPDLMLFKETAGLILRDIPGYPIGTIDSGVIVSEIPEEFLKAECTLVPLAAVMSCEKAHLSKPPGTFELIETAISKGLVESTEEFFRKYLIQGYLQAIEPLVFQEGYSLPGENLYLVLNPDQTIRGFACRDLGPVRLKKHFLEAYSWSYRYANLTKLLNVVTHSTEEHFLPSPGSPIRAGTEKTAPERNLSPYLRTIFEKTEAFEALDLLNRFAITPVQRANLLQELDDSYLSLLKQYFDLDEAEILQPDGTVPCAEKGSVAAKELVGKNKALWETRR